MIETVRGGKTVAKKKAKKSDGSIQLPAMKPGDELQIVATGTSSGDSVTIRTTGEPQRFFFDRNPECPKCHRRNSTPTGTRDGVQNRRCRMPSCRNAWKETGKRVP